MARKHTGTLASLCIAGCRCFFTLPSSQRRRVAETLLLAEAYIKEFVSQWLEQHGAKAKTA
jgi:hypothetical protein